MNVAQIILEQLGGNRFTVMTGAKNFAAGSLRLQFSIGRGALNGINKVAIVLGGNDLYRMEFWKIRGVNMECVKTVEGVYADRLRATFTEVTGMDTSL